MTIVPLHHYSRQSHLERVIEQIRTLGAPKIRACHDPVSGAWFALELWDGAGDSTLHYLSVEGADALIAALTAARDEAKRLNEEGGG